MKLSNEELFFFQDDLVKLLENAREKGLTVIEIVGTMEAVKYKMFEIGMRRAKT